MRITTLICGIVVGLAVLFFVYTFIIEGFQTAEQTARINLYLEDAKANKMTTSFGINSDTICKKYGDGTSPGDCYKCLDPDETIHPGAECGYWPQGNACIPRSGIYRLVPTWLTDMQNTDKSYPQTFDPNQFVYNVGKCGGASCASFTDCKTCASAGACGWCATTKTCMDRKVVSADWNMLGSWDVGSKGSKPPSVCPPPGSGTAINSATMITEPGDTSKNVLVQEVGTCPPETCTDKQGCFECTNTIGCGYCTTTNTCIPVDSGGQRAAGTVGSLSGSALCPTGAIRLMPYMCPCSGITECKSCSGQPGCGWCVAGKNCVNVDQSKGDGGGVKLSDCAAGINGVATFPGQCAPGKTLGNIRSERGNYKPGSAQLGIIQDNTPDFDGGRGLDLQGSGAGVIGSKPVSAAKITKVSGNGVVPGATGGPYTITNQPSLFTSPFEEYVKVLVRSELAAEGIPTDEPFENPGIVKNMMKDVSKVIKKNF